MLKGHADYELTKKQMAGAGGVLSFEVDGSGADACRVTEAFNLFTLAPSLGGVDSLVSIPVLTSHAMIASETRRKMGVTEQMIRLSVGIENVEDLIADLENGLAVLGKKNVAGAAD
jgi:cystathionine beta-lyase/cystathionine gamma-synthase